MQTEPLPPRRDPDNLRVRLAHAEPAGGLLSTWVRKDKPKPIDADGAKKLTDLAMRKGVCLDEYLAAADVSQFQPLAEVAPEQARQVWKTLQALPDAAPVPVVAPQTAAPPAPVTPNTISTPSTNNRTAARVTVPF